MVFKCLACGCSCAYDKQNAVKDVTSQQSPLKTHNLCLKGSALLQRSVLPLSATLVTSIQRAEAAIEKTNELSGACLATDGIQGYTLDVIQSRLNMRALPGGFVCNKMFDELLLYKLDISRGLIAVKCGIILTSDFQVTCSSYNEVLPLSNYEDLLSFGKQITRISQLLRLMNRLNGQDHSVIKTEADMNGFDEHYRAVIEAYDTKLETKESSICAVSDDLITRSSLSQNYLSGRSRPSAKCAVQPYTNVRRENKRVNTTPKRKRSVVVEHVASTLHSEPNVTSDLAQEYSLSAERSVAKNSQNEETFDEAKLNLPSQSITCREEYDSENSCRYEIYTRHPSSETMKTKIVKRSKPPEISAESNCLIRDVKEEAELDYETADAGTQLTDAERTTAQAVTSSRQSSDDTAQLSRCPLCKENLNTFQDLKQHIQHDHQNYGQYHCSHCEKSLSSKSHLTRHLKNMHGIVKTKILHDGPPRCQQCEKTFSSRSHLLRHLKNVHGDRKSKYDTGEFISSGTQPQESSASSKLVKIKSHTCPMCDACFHCKSYLKRHIHAIHNQEKHFHCSSCDKKFSKPQHRDGHFKSVHCKVRSYSCDQCDFICEHKKILKQHARAAHELLRRYPCPECQYSSTTNRGLKKHLSAVHYNERPYLCTICGRTFSCFSNLKTHIDGVHKGLKPHACTVCTSRFYKNAELQFHIRAVHLKLRPQSCSLCDKRFTTMAEVRKHIAVVHDDYKPFPCQQCSKRFTRRIVLSNHMRAMHQGTISLVNASVPAD